MKLSEIQQLDKIFEMMKKYRIESYEKDGIIIKRQSLELYKEYMNKKERILNHKWKKDYED